LLTKDERPDAKLTHDGTWKIAKPLPSLPSIKINIIVTYFYRN
jgi:hypothetical protein